MAVTSSSNLITLCSSDGSRFEITDGPIVAASPTIKGLLEKNPDSTIPLPTVTAATLSRVLDYVGKHFPDGHEEDDFLPLVPGADNPLQRFDDQFVNVDQETLFDLIEAAEYLQIEGLLDLTCKAVPDEMRGKTVEQIRDRFGIVSNYTKDEEEEVRRENSWAFE